MSGARKTAVRKQKQRLRVRLVLGLAALGAAASGAACSSDPSQPRYEYVPEMVDSVAYESFTANPYLPGGRTMQPPQPGTVARGQHLLHYGPGPEEAARAGLELTLPAAIAADKGVAARGEHLFQTFCFPCHGRGGEGDGPVIPKFPTPPSLLAAHARALPDGQLFHIISRGQGVMPSHAAQVGWNDRWKIIMYVRSLQGGGAPAPAPVPAEVVPASTGDGGLGAALDEPGTADGGDAGVQP